MRVSAAELLKDFEALEDKALEEPVEIVREGRPSVVLISAEEYARLRRLDRQAIWAWELTDEEIEALRKAEVPPEHAWELDEEADRQ
jgi:prevent-host-death family protein